MNLGTQDKKKTILAASLGLVALVAFSYEMYSAFGGSTPPPAATTTVTNSTTTVTPGGSRSVSTTSSVTGRNVGTNTARASADANGSRSQDPTLRFNLLTFSEHTLYNGTGRNVFSTGPSPQQVAALEKPKFPVRPEPVVAAPTGPPPPPPIDLQFYGFATSKNEKKRVFLKHGDDIFIATEGEIVDHRYRVKSVGANSVTVEDILNNNTQPLPLSAQLAG